MYKEIYGYIDNGDILYRTKLVFLILERTDKDFVSY